LIFAIIHDRGITNRPSVAGLFKKTFAIILDREGHEPAIRGRTFQRSLRSSMIAKITNRPSVPGLFQVKSGRPDAVALLLQRRNAADGLGAGAPQVYIDAIAGGGVPPARFLRGGVRNCRWL
jgi:hypothetical protein